tara:strand:+ start:965 stop:1369 length:405 start_codon:yes stop_codon:yes gene_type:complete
MLEKAAKEYTKEPSKEEKLEKATLDELDELEDDEDDEILEKYRYCSTPIPMTEALATCYFLIISLDGSDIDGDSVRTDFSCCLPDSFCHIIADVRNLPIDELQEAKDGGDASTSCAQQIWNNRRNQSALIGMDR